jgi:hypothetical protein
VCIEKPRRSLARIPNVLTLDISRLAGQPISNGTGIAAAAALGFSAVTRRGVRGFWPDALINVSRRDVRRQG